MVSHMQGKRELPPMRRIGKELTEIECLTGLASDQPPLLNGIMQRITVSPKKVVLGP